jgi:hypothetical protein
MHDNPGLIRVIVLESQEGAAILEQIRATQGRTVTALANYLAEHMALGNLHQSDPFALALSFIGMLLGLGLVGPYSYDRPITDFKREAQFVTQIFLQGVAHPQKVEIPS